MNDGQSEELCWQAVLMCNQQLPDTAGPCCFTLLSDCPGEWSCPDLCQHFTSAGGSVRWCSGGGQIALGQAEDRWGRQAGLAAQPVDSSVQGHAARHRL
jgi:hypothetical protein